jgi:PAS domain S-box-containing protein
MFDWRELRRWNISESRLPPGSLMRFREATYWEKYHWLILGVASASLIEGLLIAVLFAQLRRRRQAETFLRESEERLNLATTSAGAGLWAIDPTTKQIWLTDRARQLFGLAAGEVSDWENLLSAIHPDDREHMQNSVEEALRSGKEFIEDFRVVCANGSARWISSRGRTQFGSHVKLQRLMGACVDITERKQAEAEARKHREELAHLSRVAIMGEMAGALAHELNQPLTGIVNNASAGRRFIAKGRGDLLKLDGLFEAVAEGRAPGGWNHPGNSRHGAQRQGSPRPRERQRRHRRRAGVRPLGRARAPLHPGHGARSRVAIGRGGSGAAPASAAQQFVFDLFISKRALKQTRSVCLRAF